MAEKQTKPIKKPTSKKTPVNKKPTEKKPQGRPTDYQKGYDKIAYGLCLLSHTDEEIAKVFGVHASTIYEWKNVHPSFSEALKKGKDIADMEVAASLHKRAIGYTEQIEQPMVVSDGSQEGAHVEIVKYNKYYEPHPTAAFFWLKNRQPKKWADKQQVELSGAVVIQDDIPKEE